MRILSLIASATETICALGLEDQLVGRSHECDYPPSVQRLPAVTRPRFDTAGTSRQIDERVKELVRQSSAEAALSVYEVFPERLRELQPTHIVTQTQCEVCAVSLRDVEWTVRQIQGCNASVIALQPNALADVWEDFMRVASSLGNTAAGIRLVANLQSRMAAVENRARGLTQARVAAIEWADPLMGAGNWMPELIRMAGGYSVFGKPGAHSAAMTFEDLRKADPDVIFLAPCGYSLERTLQDVAVLEKQPGWKDLRAVRQGRVYAADGNQYFNRPGPRLVESLHILAEVLHPEAFSFGYEGASWRRCGG